MAGSNPATGTQREKVGKKYHLPPLDKLIVFLSNIGLGLKWLPLTNALAYSAVVLITTLKSFILQAFGILSQRNSETKYICHRGRRERRPNFPFYKFFK
jgi:hypothetical protein